MTRPAFIALVCVAIWVFGLLWMWIDFHYGSRVWTIKPDPILMMLAMAISVPVLAYCCLALQRRKDKGLPVFTEFSPDPEPVPEPEPRPVLQDPLDPANLLRNPPDGAQVTSHNGRRVVVLADGSIIGELLSGRARRFPSLDEFRSFVGT